MASPWRELTGTRHFESNGQTLDVRIDFAAPVGTEPPANGLTYIELMDGDPGDSLLVGTAWGYGGCTEPKIAHARQRYRDIGGITRITVLFRGVLTGP